MDFLRPRFSLVHVVLFVGVAVLLARAERPAAAHRASPAAPTALVPRPPRPATVIGAPAPPAPDPATLQRMLFDDRALLGPADPPRPGGSGCVLPRSGGVDELSSAARIVPAYRAGEPVGFKVFAIRPGSPYAAMGIKNGDLIRRVNGYELTSPEKALEAYAALKDATRFHVEVERNDVVVHLVCAR